MAALLLTAAGLSGCSAHTTNSGVSLPVVGASPDSATTQATATATPTESSPTDASTPEKAPTNEHFVQTHTIEQMDAMSLSDFAQLSYGDRLAYLLAKDSNFTVTNKQTADTLYNDPGLIPGTIWQNVLGSAAIDNNTQEGAKMLGALYYYTSDINTGKISDAFQKSTDSILTNGGLASGIGYKYVDKGEWQQMADRDGTQIEYVDITFNYISLAMADAGAVTSGDITAQAIRAQVKLLDGTVATCYPIGYTIDGHNSPIDGRNY